METISRLSINQATLKYLSLREVVAACVQFGVPSVGLWRDRVAEMGLAESARLVRDAGLRVSSLCRGGWFDGATSAARARQLDDNRRAVEEAAHLGTDVLVLVCGPAAAGHTLADARAYVGEAIATLAPFAAQHGVRLAIEPMHPMYTAERSVINTLAQANRLAALCAPERVGVIADVYHVWWDPDIAQSIHDAQGRIYGFHVSDWLVPTPDMLNGRGMMGDGVIPIRALRELVDATGYGGPIEVEIFNLALWEAPADVTMPRIIETYHQHV